MIQLIDLNEFKMIIKQRQFISALTKSTNLINKNQLNLLNY